jgi:hypothetical protein
MRRLLAAAAALAVVVTIPAPAPALAATLPKPVPCEGCWRPGLHTGWQWQLQGQIDLSVRADAYDIDLFDESASTVKAIHDKARKAVCYLDAGTGENWRPDKGTFPKSVLGAHNGWPGERWLDIRRLAVLGPIMKARLDLCASKGFDAVEFDNVDGYTNHSGFPLTGAVQLRFNVFLANQTHRRGLSAALKNDLDQIPKLLPYFDFALDEQCFQYHECTTLTPFIEAGKAVFEVEYRLERSKFCPKAKQLGFNSMRKRLSLGPWRRVCA